MSTRELARRSFIEPRRLPSYVLNLRPVTVLRRAARVVLTWIQAVLITLVIYGTFGLLFLATAWVAR